MPLVCQLLFYNDSCVIVLKDVVALLLYWVP